MITADAADLDASLQKFIETAERKLKNVAKGFAYEFSVFAVGNTPLGNADTYMNLYLRRYFTEGLEPEEGFARGAWQVSFDGSLSAIERYGQSSGDEATASIKMELNGYKLGQTITIGNYGPYIMDLQQGYSPQAPEGISKPTIDQVLQAYLINVKKYYEAG